ncbi:MAG: ABC transporter substrate-binding protein [Nocardioidaceae bacterium]
MVQSRLSVRRLRPLTVLMAAATVVAMLAAGCSSSSKKTTGGDGSTGKKAGGGTVAFLLPENVTARWEGQDKPFFVAALKKYAPDAKVEVENALNDQSKQQAQAESALAKGAKVLVVIPVDQKGAARIVTTAKQQNVPVVAYDRLINDSPVADYVSVDGVKIGELQGKWLAEHTSKGANIAVINGSPTDDNAHLFNKGYLSVLNPLFSSGERKKIAEVSTPGWEPPKAQAEMEQILTSSNNNVQGVLSANDGMAAAIIAALRSQHLAGKVPVTGLDGTAEGLNLILRGEQGMSAYRSLKEQADKAAQIAAALMQGKAPPSTLFNGATKNNGAVDVPWAQVTPQVIDKSNVDLVISEGAAAKADVCKGVAAGTGPC